MSLTVLVDGELVAVALTRTGDAIVARVGDAEYRGSIQRRGETWRLERGTRALAATVVRDRDEVWIALAGEIYRCALATEERGEAGAGAVGSPRVTAPMPGKVLDVLVREGQQVAAGDALVILEAMKMETVASADAAGTVTRVHVATGTMVEPGQVLVELELA
jgi:acetyl-CoA/propionyl-CoA carboxylase biotin carboxyl carrier protein